MNESFMEELDILEREKGVPKETILDALANALVSAYKRSPGAAEEARVTIDQDTGEIIVYGQELDEDGNVVREWEDTPDDFGRIGAQTAKQVILQRLRDAKRAQVYEIYQGREGDLVTGIVQQSDHRTVILDLGNAEAVMPFGEKIPYERLERGARVKALILEVRDEESKGPQIVASRSHPDFIRRLFELEVPELVEGIVEIRAIARDAGHRTKIAVVSSDPNVDPIGACVGSRGSRVRQVVNELRGEKVDIVEFREDTHQFIEEALKPANVRKVILDEETMEATVIVPDHQLSLAIGKEGQNARLAARLSGYRIDIQPENPPPEETEEAPADEAAEGASEAETTADTTLAEAPATDADATGDEGEAPATDDAADTEPVAVEDADDVDADTTEEPDAEGEPSSSDDAPASDDGAATEDEDAAGDEPASESTEKVDAESAAEDEDPPAGA